MSRQEDAQSSSGVLAGVRWLLLMRCLPELRPAARHDASNTHGGSSSSKRCQAAGRSTGSKDSNCTPVLQT